MYQFLRQDCNMLCKMLHRLIGLLCCINSHGLTQCILEYMDTIPKITSPMKLKGLREPLKKGYLLYIVHILPAKFGFVCIFMIGWINLFHGLSLKYTKQCQALLKYCCLCNICFVLVFLWKQRNTTQKFWMHTEIWTNPKKSHKFWNKMVKLIASDRSLTFKTHFI